MPRSGGKSLSSCLVSILTSVTSAPYTIHTIQTTDPLIYSPVHRTEKLVLMVVVVAVVVVVIVVVVVVVILVVVVVVVAVVVVVVVIGYSSSSISTITVAEYSTFYLTFCYQSKLIKSSPIKIFWLSNGFPSNEAGIADVQPLPVKLCGGGANVSRGDDDDGGGGGGGGGGGFKVKVMLAVAVHAFVLLDSPFYHSCPHYHLFSNCNLLLMIVLVTVTTVYALMYECELHRGNERKNCRVFFSNPVIDNSKDKAEVKTFYSISMNLFMLIAPHKNLGHTVIDTRQKYLCVNSCLINGSLNVKNIDCAGVGYYSLPYREHRKACLPPQLSSAFMLRIHVGLRYQNSLTQ
ncbi:hypothetical protein GQX74_004280 [Glossina fuscipes]|nr:hypothetical protein GQX74_004280 [Glossina fuscipes]